MAEPYLRLRYELGLAINRAWGTTVDWPWSLLGPKNRPVAGRQTSSLAGVYSPVCTGPWFVSQPPYLHATVEVGPRDGIWLASECLLP